MVTMTQTWKLQRIDNPMRNQSEPCEGVVVKSYDAVRNTWYIQLAFHGLLFMIKPADKDQQ